MRLSSHRGPSPALIVAAIALIFAIAGTAIAGPDAISNKITKAKVKKIAKKQANKVLDSRESSLNVNSAKTAGQRQDGRQRQDGQDRRQRDQCDDGRYRGQRASAQRQHSCGRGRPQRPRRPYEQQLRRGLRAGSRRAAGRPCCADPAERLAHL